MPPFSPAVDRYLKSCRTNNIQGVRAYLTTIHCNPHWAYRGVQYSFEGLSVAALQMICQYKCKVNADHDHEWIQIATDSFKRLLISNSDHNDAAKLADLLLQTHPQPNLDILTRSFGEIENVALLEVVLPHLTIEQKNSVFENACRNSNNTMYVERLLLEVNVEHLWTKIQNDWYKPSAENNVVVENFLQRKTLLNEIGLLDENPVARRKM